MKTNIKTIFFLLFSLSMLFASEFSYRKYSHVKEFYEPLARKTIEICVKNNIPPAAVLAIAGVESGYGSGYISKITGNILSLGANKNDAMLPPVTLPSHKGEVIISQSEIQIRKIKPIKRPASLKKDCRPPSIAGSTRHLDYFLLHPSKKADANIKCIEVFATTWINKNNSHAPFKEARIKMNKLVKESGKEILFSKQTNEEFIRTIGGKKDSFNHRKTWPIKVIKVMEKVGLVELTREMYKNNKQFKEVW